MTEVRAEHVSSPHAISEHCDHCGQVFTEPPLTSEGKHFCCVGCESVFHILSENKLDQYYCLNDRPGSTVRDKRPEGYFAFLEDANVRAGLVAFTDGTRTTVQLSVPMVHCSSCVFLLESLHKLHEGVSRARVNFIKREVTIEFDERKTNLREVVELMTSVGYEPDFNLGSTHQNKAGKPMASYYKKLGLAFFCFGNIMLLSFPEYLGIDALVEQSHRAFFGYMNMALATPVLLYSSQDFFRSAWAGLRQRFLNIDVPIVLGILIMYIRSSWEVLSGTGAGYFDTLASLVFLMLVGRLFQNKSYHRISFEHDYKSYFPISVMRLEQGKEVSVPIANVVPGDRLVIRNMELVPADSVLMKGDARIDYSFVTGEGEPVKHNAGNLIFAGGRQVGSMIEVEVSKSVSQSYLTQLWNNDAFRKHGSKEITQLANRISHSYFTPIILAISLLAAAYWLVYDPSKAMPAFTAILIITCPCALALSSPFTLGNIVRLLGKYGFYLKNANVVERINQVTDFVFDKTGTLTERNMSAVTWVGTELEPSERQAIFSLVRHSTHPLSRSIGEHLKGDWSPITGFQEVSGQGIMGEVDGWEAKIGSYTFVTGLAAPANTSETRVYVGFDGQLRGHFAMQAAYREGMIDILNYLRTDHHLYLLSGDNEQEKAALLPYFGDADSMRFRQTPGDKLEFVNQLQQGGRRVMMMGDGLNDAGALQEAHVGVAISEQVNQFSPACDAILDASKFHMLPRFLRVAKAGIRIMMASFGISFLYNIIGLYFAVQGTMSPIVAAILMPISSVTIILFTTLASRAAAVYYMNRP